MTMLMDAVSRPAGRVEVDRVHVVTVTYNSKRTLRQYFEGLDSAAERLGGVTVVDNGSSDGTRAALHRLAAGRRYPVQIIENVNSGFAGGYAAAARSSVGDGCPVLCLNPDVILAPGSVDALLDVLGSFADAGIVTMPLVEADGTPDTASRRRLPTLGASMVYSVLGRLTPRAIRYNAREDEPGPVLRSRGGRDVSVLEATTGALMLVASGFRTLAEGVFDQDYWMYGEDLQLCADARRLGLRVLMAEVAPSVHIKGVSSGRPRSRRSNRAFHDAMYRYAEKNLLTSPVVAIGVRCGVWAHFLLSEAGAAPVRLRRRLHRS